MIDIQLLLPLYFKRKMSAVLGRKKRYSGFQKNKKIKQQEQIKLNDN